MRRASRGESRLDCVWFAAEHVVMANADSELLARITVNPEIFGGKPIIRGRRLAVEHVLGMLAAGDTAETLLANTHGCSQKTCAPASFTPAALWVTNGLNCPSCQKPRESHPR
jgi:uncharacterized protein (DUF433 family)